MNRKAVRKVAFTLAEVLITLGIIGVVAAITMPTLIQNYKRKELEVKFQKSYSLVSQISQGLEQELGSCEREQTTNIEQYMFNNFKVLKTGKNVRRDLEYRFKTYNLALTDAVIHPNCLDARAGQGNYFYMVTTDGTLLALCSNYSYATMISIDTNGFNKGPNAFGHDLFFFYFNNKNCKLTPFEAQWRTCYDKEDGCDGKSDSLNGFKWTNGTCFSNSKNSENGFVCVKYAIENRCPNAPSKGDWECLL